MTRPVAILFLATLALAGCQRKEGAPVAGGLAALFGAKARYIGVGLYSPGRMWEQLVRADAPKDAAAAQLKDDEQVVVVLDSLTGEVRQCGNLSGYCTRMNPWTASSTPAQLARHAEQLDAEAAQASAPLTGPRRRAPRP